MQIHFINVVTAANLLVLLGIYRKMSIIVYQHKLMWTRLCRPQRHWRKR
jgi:hypothetical protein